MQHFGCSEEQGWSCVEAHFQEGGSHASLWGWLYILQQAENGDVVTSYGMDLGKGHSLTGMFQKNYSGVIEIVMDNGHSPVLPESLFAHYATSFSFGSSYSLYNLQGPPPGYMIGGVPTGGILKAATDASTKHEHPCSVWDCTALGYDVAAIGGSALMDISLSGELFTGGFSTAGVVTGLAINRAATTAGMIRTVQGYRTGGSSTADLVVVAVTSTLNPFPVVGTAAGFGQLLWDLADPFHPW